MSSIVNEHIDETLFPLTPGYYANFRSAKVELGTVGLSVGVTLPTTPPVVLWTEIVGMLFGRLEIYVILIAVIKFFKDARSMVVTEK